ncbi:hypothetical protein [Actinomadura sp. NPDC000600]|uniref:hypothetical protein n=1 Tax=Actinomadura sp. NPDC000600 TaxID=3154262 RepID=UPI0033984267
MKPNLTEGPYCDAQQVAKASSRFYTAAGIDPGAASGLALHPMVDHLACARWCGGDAGPVPPEYLEPVGNGTVRAWLDRGHPADAALMRTLNSLADREHGRVEPEDEQGRTALEALLTEADALLRARIPELWDQVRCFVTRAALTRDEHIAGASWDDLAGAVVLGTRLEHRPDAAAEALLHEAVHAKTYRLTRGFERAFIESTPEFIDIPWWRTETSSRRWDSDRAFSAFPVYAHLSHYYERVVRLSADPERDGSLHCLQRTSFRARYLANLVLQLDDRLLDGERRALVRRLAEAVPEPPCLNAAGAAALRLDLRSFPGAERALCFTS